MQLLPAHLSHLATTHDMALLTTLGEELMGCSDERQCQPGVNQDRNRALSAAILRLGYGVGKVAGGATDCATNPQLQASSDSYLVINLKADTRFFARVTTLGQHFGQDFIFCKPMDQENGYLMGTNRSELPGPGQQVPVGSFSHEGAFFLRMSGRVFRFGRLQTYDAQGRNARLVISGVGDRVLRECHLYE